MGVLRLPHFVTEVKCTMPSISKCLKNTTPSLPSHQIHVTNNPPVSTDNNLTAQ